MDSIVFTHTLGERLASAYGRGLRVKVDRARALAGHGRLGEGTTTQFRLSSERDGCSGQNGAFNNASGSKGGGAAESP